MIQQRLHIIALVFSLFICLSFAGQAASPAKELTAIWQSVKTYQAQFTQTVFNPAIHSRQESTGQMKWSRPDYFRWDIEQPTDQTILLKKNELWIYDRDLEQVTIQTLQEEQEHSLVWLFSATTEELEQRFIIERLEAQAGRRGFLLRPHNDEQLFQEVELQFKDNQITYVRMLDHVGQITEINFSDIQLNQPLDVTAFALEIPDDVEVIDARE